MSERWLCGWKQIADYLGCSIWTAQDYHRRHSMPVYIKSHKPRAIRSEIDEWVKESDSIAKKIEKKLLL